VTTEGFIDDTNPYKDKVILITGSTKGIGRAMAKHAKDQGAKAVIINGRDETTVNETKKTLGVDGYVADIGNYDECKKMVVYAQDNHTHVDILINNAVVVLGKQGLLSIDHKAWETEMRTNVNGSLYMSQLVLASATSSLPVKVVNIGSGAANSSGSDDIPGSYVIAKNALNKMTAVMASEVPNGSLVALMQIDGTVDTDLTRDLGKTAGLSMDTVMSCLDAVLQKTASMANGKIFSTTGMVGKEGFEGEMAEEAAEVEEVEEEEEGDGGADSGLVPLDGTNPLGSSPYMKLAGMSDYPSKDRAEELTEVLAQMNKVESKNIALFPGTIAAIESIASATLKQGSTIACADPGWSVFEKHMGMRQYKLNRVSFKPMREKALLEELGEEALKGGVDMIYLTSPQFPSGRSLEAADVETLMEVVPQHVIVIIDQCYLEYAKKGAFNAASLVKQHRNLVVTRSLSKFYGLASIRISYTISDPEVATALYLYNHTNPFLSNYMVDAAMSTLKDDDFHKRVYKHNETEKKRITVVLKGKGVDVVPGSDANYILAKVGDDTHFTDIILRLHKNGYKSFQHRLYFDKYYQVMISSKEANDMQASVLP